MNKICSKCRFKKTLFVIDDSSGIKIHDVIYKCKNIAYKEHLIQTFIEKGILFNYPVWDIGKITFGTGKITTKCAFFKEEK